MTPFTFIVMLLAQRADEALRLEKQRQRPDPCSMATLRTRKQRLSARLCRRLPAAVPAGR
jgi:hypothetical protein